QRQSVTLSLHDALPICVRVDEPEGLAKYVLRDRPEWDAEHMQAAMNAGVEKQVKLSETIPVFIVYFTSWVDEAGRLHLAPDVYRSEEHTSELQSLRHLV